MERMTTNNPETNREALLNFAYAKDGRVYLRYADGREDIDLCEYVAKNACCEDIDVAAVMDGACVECDCKMAVLYSIAVQAAELRAKLSAYEDTGLTPEEAAGLRNTCDQLQGLNDSLFAANQAMGKDIAEWKKAEDEGKVKWLPCDVGYTVYDRDGEPWNVASVEWFSRKVTQLHCVSPVTGHRQTFSVGKRSLGKTVFLSREESVAAKKRTSE